TSSLASGGSVRRLYPRCTDGFKFEARSSSRIDAWRRKKEGRPEGRPLEAELALGGPDAVRPRALLALLDVEADGLATAQAVEVEGRIDATLMEEILLTIVGGNEPKSAVGNDLLDGALWHVPNSSSRTRPVTHRPVRERRIRAAREIARRPDDRR